MSFSHLVLVVVLVACAAFAAWLASQVRLSRRRQFVRRARFPDSAFRALHEKFPHLERRDLSLVAQGLRQFFLAYLQSGRLYVSMPSKVVDELWHALILDTRAYADFCRQAFGDFFHHVPASRITPMGDHNVGLRRTWWFVCREENIDPRRPLRIPLLFALDAKLRIPGGYVYTLPGLGALAASKGETSTSSSCGGGGGCGGDSDAQSVEIFCDKSVDGSTEGLGDTSSDASGDGGGCGGGCGGD